MRIGLIVPVYNVEKYVAKCLDSILAQSYQDFVIVLVNDASTDSSRDICFRYYNLDKRIVVLDSVANAGQASVRNVALKFFTHKGTLDTLSLPNITIYTHFESIPQCQYIKFIDSDDSITKDCLKICLKAIQTYQVDVLIHDWYCLTESGEVRNEMFFKKFLNLDESEYYKPMDTATFFAKRKKGIAGFVCNALYDIRLFYNPYARFLEGVIFEDVLSYFVFFSFVKKVIYIPEMLYVVFERENSTMRFREDNVDVSALPTYQQPLAKLFRSPYNAYLYHTHYSSLRMASELLHFAQVYQSMPTSEVNILKELYRGLREILSSATLISLPIMRENIDPNNARDLLRSLCAPKVVLACYTPRLFYSLWKLKQLLKAYAQKLRHLQGSLESTASKSHLGGGDREKTLKDIYTPLPHTTLNNLTHKANYNVA